MRREETEDDDEYGSSKNSPFFVEFVESRSLPSHGREFLDAPHLFPSPNFLASPREFKILAFLLSSTSNRDSEQREKLGRI